MNVGPDIYTHFDGLAELRRHARAQDPAATRTVAQQFEGLFLHMMLKSMRQASFGDPLLGSRDADFYRDLFDQQLATHLGQTGSVGIADLLERQLTLTPGGHPDPLARAPLRRPPGPVTAATTVDTPVPTDGHAPRSSVAAAVPESVAPAPPFAAPRQFVEQLLPLARQAAAELGTDPGVLLAQAALETGWGRHILRNPDGSSSHNLFNIKADGRWDGPRATVNTLEYREGTFQRERAAFRAYPDFAASFADYVALVRGSARYRGALEAVAEPEAFLHALHQAGYATDPDYADKVLRLWRQDLPAMTAPEAHHG